MRVFVAFGYQPSDQWIRELIIPLLKAMGIEPVSGEDMQGERLQSGVEQRIEDSDVLLAFLTRRGTADEQGNFGTHTWVGQEVALALSMEKPAFELYESRVLRQPGIAGDRQYYLFNDKSLLMIEIVKFLTKEKEKLAYKTFMLLPSEFSSAISSQARFTRCTYKFLHKGKEYEEENAALKRLHGGFGLIIKKIPHEEALVEINVTSPAGNWNSGFVSVGLTNIHLIRE